jgi:hypothetical protein
MTSSNGSEGSTEIPLFVESEGDAVTNQIMAEALIEQGLMTREELANQTMGQSGPIQTHDMSALDAAIFAPPKDASGYDFSGMAMPSTSEIAPDELNQITTSMREAFLDARIPSSVGSDLAKRMFASFDKEEMPEPQLRADKHRALDYLNKLWGDRTENNIALANALVDRLDARLPVFKQGLKHSGLANDPMVIVALYNSAIANWAQ